MSKRRSAVFFISYMLLFIICLYVIYIYLFMDRNKQYWMYYDFPISNLLLFAIAFFVGVLLWLIIRNVDLNGKRIIRGFKFKISILTIILLIVQCIIVNDIFFYIDWDVKYIKEAAYQYLYGGGLNEFYSNYFHVNPNNVLMLSITIAFMKLGNIINCNGYMMLLYAGVILNNLAVLFTALSVKKMTMSDRKAFVTYILAALFFGLSPWLIAPYTDTFSLIIPITTFYIFVSVSDKKVHWIKKVISVVLLPSVFVMLKPTNIFILLAVFAYEVVVLTRDGNKKETALKIIMGIIIAIVIMFVSRLVTYTIIDYKEDKSVEKPMAHYMLLGSNEGMVGMYSQPDDDYTNSFEGIDSKKDADYELIERRYKEMGVEGYFKHLSRKTYLNYANGIFGWGKEQNFVNEIDSKRETFFRNIYYVGGDHLLIEENSFNVAGNYFSIYSSVCQVIWYIVVVICALKSLENMIMEIRRKSVLSVDNSKAVLSITLIGLFVFMSVFETNARYIYSLLPLYVVYSNSKSFKKV